MSEQETNTVDLAIEKIVTGGRGLGRHEGEAVFVPLAAPGDLIRARLAKRHKGYREAELLEVLEPGPGRRDAPCPHFADCGGCDLQQLDDDAQAAARREVLLDCFTRLGRVDVSGALEEPAPSPALAYRNRIRLSQHPTGPYGLKRRGSHDVVLMEQCPVMVEPFAETILPWLRFLPPMEQIVVRMDGRGGWLLSLYGPPTRTKLLKSIVAQAGADGAPAPGLKGLLLNNRPYWGRTYLVMEVAGHKFRVSHNSFFQANLDGAEQALATVRAWLDDLPAGGDLADLYGGVGLFALGLADRFDRIVSIDSDSAAAQDARENVRRSSVEVDRITVREGQVQDELAAPEVKEALNWPEACVMVDPPRTGLGKPVLAALGELKPRAVVYLSCDPATLARDCAALVAVGYAVTRVRPVPMFPQTSHVETLVLLTRSET